jgi:hypothetical protein
MNKAQTHFVAATKAGNNIMAQFNTGGQEPIVLDVLEINLRRQTIKEEMETCTNGAARTALQAEAAELQKAVEAIRSAKQTREAGRLMSRWPE